MRRPLPAPASRVTVSVAAIAPRLICCPRLARSAGSIWSNPGGRRRRKSSDLLLTLFSSQAQDTPSWLPSVRAKPVMLAIVNSPSVQGRAGTRRSSSYSRAWQAQQPGSLPGMPYQGDVVIVLGEGAGEEVSARAVGDEIELVMLRRLHCCPQRRAAG